MEEEKEFNSSKYAFKMLVCSILWIILASWILFELPNYPQKIVEIKLNNIDTFTFELNIIIVALIALIGQYLLFSKSGLYHYVFKTDCKNPILCLFLNILFGSFIVLISAEIVQYQGIEAMTVVEAFAIMAIVNYFIFYSRHGYDYREQAYIEDWKKKVYPPLECLDKDKQQF